MTGAGSPHGPDVREQRLVFGEDAELYEKARAGYPESLVDDVLAFVGVEASQVILNGGANDFGGTLMEETISRMAGAEWGIRMEPDEFERAIREMADLPSEISWSTAT